MLKSPLWTTLIILTDLMACGEQTPTPGKVWRRPLRPSPTSPAPEPTETSQAAGTASTGPQCRGNNVASQHASPAGQVRADSGSGGTHPSPDTCVGDPDTRDHGGLHADERRTDTGFHARNTHAVADSGIFDADFHPGPASCRSGGDTGHPSTPKATDSSILTNVAPASAHQFRDWYRLTPSVPAKREATLELLIRSWEDINDGDIE